MGKQIRQEISSAALADEVDLLRRVANGERLGFDVFYRAYYRRLHRFLEQVIRRPELIGEVLNDAMLVVWHKAGTFNQASRVSTWVFAIAYRRALKALKRAPNRSIEVDMAEEPVQAASPSATGRRWKRACPRINRPASTLARSRAMSTCPSLAWVYKRTVAMPAAGATPCPGVVAHHHLSAPDEVRG